MRLTDRHPKWERDVLVFDCPCQSGHRLRVAAARHKASKNIWLVKGDSFSNYSITPSIRANCWHGCIRNGEVVTFTEPQEN
jgi:hypothetical protein